MKKEKYYIVEITNLNMNFNTNEINTSLQQKFGSEATRVASLFAVNREALFILPAFQQQIFNFLFYEKQWRFDRLHEMMLLFQPGIELALQLGTGCCHRQSQRAGPRWRRANGAGCRARRFPAPAPTAARSWPGGAAGARCQRSTLPQSPA